MYNKNNIVPKKHVLFNQILNNVSFQKNTKMKISKHKKEEFWKRKNTSVNMSIH